jgi:hypothetical protein
MTHSEPARTHSHRAGFVGRHINGCPAAAARRPHIPAGRNYRSQFDHVGNRWRDTGRSPGIVIHLVRAFLDGTTALRENYRQTDRNRDRHYLENDLVACYFTIRKPR